MPNEAHTFGSVTLEARHVPEPDETYDPSAHDDPNHVTGFVDIGANVDGVFVPLARRKASGLFADIERAEANRPATEEPQPQGQGEPQPQGQGEPQPPASPSW